MYSLRFDINLSIRNECRKVAWEKRNRVEIKNINSFRSMRQLIHYESSRQKKMLKDNGVVEQETRSFNRVSNSTSFLRGKSSGIFYRCVRILSLYLLLLFFSLGILKKKIFRAYFGACKTTGGINSLFHHKTILIKGNTSFYVFI